MLLLFLLIIVANCDEIDDRMSNLYFKYPDTYIPDVNYILATPSLDVNAFNPDVYIDDIDLDNREAILEAYKFSEHFQGFIFEGDTVKFTIMKNNTKDFTGDFGKMIKKTGYKYYEKIPRINSKNIYIDMGLGYAQNMRENIREYCFYNSEPTKELCDKIPKCLGYIPGECLISYKALAEKEIENAFEYHEKINEHSIFKWVSNNLLLTAFITLATLVVQTALFNFNFLIPILKNTFRVADGASKYIGGRKKKNVVGSKAEITYEF